MRSRSVRHQLWLLAAVLCSITLIVNAVNLISLRAEAVEITDLTTVSGPAYQLNAGILQMMTNAETGLRGYLDIGDPELLAPYDGAEQQVRAAQGRLRALLASSRVGPADQRRYARLQAAQDTAIASWWRYAANAQADSTSARSADLIADKTIFDALRAANAALAGTLTARLDVVRTLSRQRLYHVVVILLVTTLLALLAGLAVASGISRAVTAPLIRLRQVVHRHREGETDLRADTGSGPSEVRELAAAFNMLSAHNAGLAAEQDGALRLQQRTFEIGRAIRVTSDAHEAMEVACRELGAALAARRVIVTTFDETRKISAGGQWHAPGLADLAGVTEGLEAHLARVSGELWSSGGRLVIDDLTAADGQDQEWARQIHRQTGTTALILVPIGQGERAIGNLYAGTDTGPRRWTAAEAATVQQVATFLSRAIHQAEVEAQRGEYVSRLEHLDRQKTEFLSTVSHELRTPLTSIQGYLELLLEGEVGALGPDQQHMLGIIERNTVRLRGLIEDILVLNRIESGGLQVGHSEVSMRELVDHTVEELRPLAAKKAIRLCVDNEGHDPAEVIGDRTQLQRALVNILSNAIKFTPGEGTVRLCRQADPAAGEVVVTCEDTGIGIPEADLEHLFTRFYRASNAASQAIPGTGLGLAIVQAIVEIHHGRLTLDSIEGKGTTITLRFPSAGTPARADLPDPSEPDARLRGDLAGHFGYLLDERLLGLGFQERRPHPVHGQRGQLVPAEPEHRGGPPVLIGERGPEHGRVIAVQRHEQPLGQHPRQRVRGQARHLPGADVGGGAHFQRYLAFPQVRHQVRIGQAAQPVPDPLGPQAGQRLPDRRRARHLARVRHAVQPGRYRRAEHLAEHPGPGRPRLLDAGQPEPGQRLRRAGERVLQRRARGGSAELTRDVEDVADPHPVVPPRRARRHVQRLGQAGHRHAGRGERVRGDGQLRVPDVLPGQIACRAEDELRDVGGLPHQGADRSVHVREVREVPELVERDQLGLGPRHLGFGMPAGQLEHGRHRGGTDQVKVKFHLRQPGDERVGRLHKPTLAAPSGNAASS
jgi:signal transduction histidine kinase/CHASE3 domain sensor protein